MPQSVTATTAHDALDAALLARAAYIDFHPADGATPTSLRVALTFKGGFTEAEADYIVERYELLSVTSDPVDPLSFAVGFKGTLWRRLDVGASLFDEYVVAFGGTDLDSLGAATQDIIADGLLGVTGEALGQTQALKVWVERLYTGTSATVFGLPGLGLLDRFDVVDVTGHSLGGHLVQYAVGQFNAGNPDRNLWLPDQAFTDGYTFNGAGIGRFFGLGIPGNPKKLLGQLGYLTSANTAIRGNYLWNEGNFGIENFISEAGISVVPTWISGMRPGEDASLFIEDQGSHPDAIRSVIGNHGVIYQVDSLFVYNIFEGFVGSDQAPLERVAFMQDMLSILRASSNDAFESLERVVNHLREFFPNIVADPNLGPAAREDRNALIALSIAISDELEANPRPATITNLVTDGELFNSIIARMDTPEGLARRVALILGQPFVLDGLDYQAAFNQNGDYDLENFTDKFLKDRAAYAAALFEANAEDVEAGGRVSLFPHYFENRLGEFESIVAYDNARGEPPPINELKQTLFGGDDADTLAGGDEDDAIYGLDGADILEGGEGNDYIEGGDGNDELTGGAGNNVLLGGDGFDTYRVGVNERVDITDSDGFGAIVVELSDGTFFTLGSQTVSAVADQADVYRDDAGFTYVVNGPDVIVSTPDGGQIAIREFDFLLDSLGINLGGFQGIDPPGQALTFDVDFTIQPPPGDPNSINQLGNFSNGTQQWLSPGFWFLRQDVEVINAVAVPDGALNGSITEFVTIIGGFGDSFMTGDDGFNIFRDDGGLFPSTPYLGGYGMGPVMGNDVLDGRGGDDWLFSSGGDDFVMGGAGNDIIVDSHSGFDITQALNGDPLPLEFTSYGDVEWITLPGNSSNDTLLGGTGDDYIAAHGGNQVMDGGDGADELFAGAGDDVLIGGAGDDVLLGDTRLSDSPIEMAPGTVPADFEFVFNGDNLTFDASSSDQWGNDTLDGGEGNDTLYGGAGNDSLSGGAGNDRLQGDFVFAYADLRAGLLNRPTDPTSIHGDDILLGGAGNDELLGYGGDDLIEGGDDDDVAAGGEGSDIVRGDGGNDELQGNEGDDFLFGGDGDDTLFGQEDNDELHGEEGADQLVGGDGDDFLSGGNGDDALFGEAGQDTLLGGAGIDDLQGGDDDDFLIGGVGNDLLFGGAGDDTYIITGSDGQDQLTDTQGSNRLVFNFVPTELSVSIENGVYFVDYAPGNYLFMDAETFNSIDEIEFLGGITVDRDVFVDQYQPGNSNGGLITLANGALAGDLTIFARNDDLIISYNGPVVDWIDVAALSDRDILAIEGDALDFGAATSAPAIALKNWYLAGPLGYVRFITDGVGGNINLDNDAPVARIFDGGPDESLLTGSDEADTFSGGAGHDIFIAGDGDDQITGGEDADTLIGGPGNDAYFYNIADGNDIIADESGVDSLTFGPGISAADLTITMNSGALVIQIGPEENFDKITVSDWLADTDRPIDSIVFDDGSSLTVAEIEALVTGNRAPTLVTPFTDLELSFEQPFSFDIPAGSFTDPNGDALTYDAQLSDGSPLPSWLSFDPLTQTFSGITPPQLESGTFSIIVTARDPLGLPVSDTFTFSVGLNRILGTAGNDTLAGDALDNTILGFTGDDRLSGGDGNDFIRGDEGRDFLFGDAGDDTLFSNLGFDDLRGGAGNDLLISGPDADGSRQFGEDGDDRLIGGPGRDAFDGGDGNNTYEIGLGGGVDTLNYQSLGTHTVRFGAGIQLSDLTASFEGLGNQFDLTIFYNPSDATDNITLDEVFIRTISNGGQQASPPFTIDPLNYVFEFEDGSSVTVIELGDLAVIPTDGADFIFPNSQNDIVFGGDGDDVILGRTYQFNSDLNANTLFGEGGNDDIEGGVGDDFLSGGDGDDELGGGDGDDTMEGGLGDDFLSAGDGNDNLDGGDGADSLHGGRGDDIIMGGAGDDVITGDPQAFNFDGFDQLFGESGNDNIFGGARADLIEGGSGDDIIDGGSSSVDLRDTLRGGTGDDQFVEARDSGATHYLYDAGDGHDTISDTGHVDLIGTGGEVFLLEDRFEFVDGSGIQLNDLQVTRVDDNLVLTVSPTDSITFQNWFLSIDNQIEEFITYDIAGNPIVNTAADIEALIDTVNAAPVLDNPLADNAATEGQVVSIAVPANTFSDPDAGDVLSYSARLVGGAALPAWLSFDAATQTFTGTPPNNSNGNLDIEVTVTDAGGLSVSDEFSLAIADANFAPQLDNAIADTSVAEDSALNYTVPADAFSDSDIGDLLSYSAQLSGGGALPLWLNFDAITRTFTGTPPNNTNGDIDIEVIATDGDGLSASDIFTLAVTDTNFVPTLDNAITDAAATEGEVLNLVLPANTFSDPDTGDTLTYSAQLSGGGALPTWLSFDAATRTFTGIPPNNSNGNVDVEVTATDNGGLSASDVFTIGIADANFAPSLDNAIADASATEGQVLSFTVPVDAFSDADAGDTLSYSAQLSGGGALPAWLSFNAATRTFAGIPPNNSNGTIDVEVVATDSGGLSASDVFTIDVADANFVPSLDNAIADAVATEGEALNLVVPANTFSDPDTGDTLTYSAQVSGGGALPAWLSFDVATRTFTGIPPNNSNGTIDIEVVATDSGGLSASDVFTIDIADANFVPTLDNAIAAAAATEGEALNLVLPANTFSDPDAGDTLSYSAQVSGGGALPAWLSFDAATRTFTGIPPNNSNGSVDIEVIATDGSGLSVSDVFTIDIADANFVATLDNAIADAAATEGEALNLVLPANTFSDPDAGDTLTYSAQLSGGGALPAWLNFDGATRTFNGIPPNNSNGTVDIEVIATDSGGLSVSDTFTLDIVDANFAPRLDNALADAAATEGQVFSLTLPADAFSDPDVGDVLTFSAQLSGGGVLPGWLSFDALTRTFSGIPPNDASGTIDVEVVATDSGGLSISDTFTLNVLDENFAPTLDNAIADTAATEGEALNLVVPASTFSDPDTGDTLTYSAQVSGGGALPAWLSFDAATRTFTGIPPNNSNGPIDIEVVATDGGGLSASDVFTIDIADENFVPMLDNAIADAAATEGESLNFALSADTFSDSDSGDVLTYTAQLSGGGALPVWLSFDAATLTFSGIPPNNSNGSVDIEVIATDDGGLFASDTFTLDIADTNFAPTLNNAVADVNATEGQLFSVTVPADAFGDPDAGDTLSYSAQLSGGGGLPAWLSFDAATRTFTGIPPNNSNGTVDIEVIATDSGGLTASDVFSLDIADVNFAPLLDNPLLDAGIIEGQAFSFAIAADAFSDSDVGDVLAFTAQISGGGALPAWLNFDPVTQTFSGTPPNSSAGDVSIEVIATDSGGLSVSDVFILTISDTNVAPILDNPIADANANEGQALSITVAPDAFSDPDAGDTLTYSARLAGGGALPAWLAFDAVSRTFTGTPPNNSNGSIEIEVVATDSGGLSASDSFTLDIGDVNFAPMLDNAVADAAVTEGEVLNVVLPANTFSDPDVGDTLSYSAQLSGGGTLPLWLSFDAETRTFTGIPPNNSNGSIDIEVIATDSGGLSASDVFTLDIADANFAPTLDNAIADAAAGEGEALNLVLPANTFSDPDTGDTLTYSAQSAGGGALPAWLDFDTVTRTFSGTPPNNSNGSVDVEVTATDTGGLSVSDTFTISIADANFVPNLDNAITDVNATEGEIFSFAVPANTFSDPDNGDTLVYSAQSTGGGALPAWLAFDAVTRTFSGTPPNNSNGSVDVEVIATDSGGLSATDIFTLDIADANFAPTLDNPIADTGATEGQLFSLTVATDAFSDPDVGDVLTYSAQLGGGGALPAWLSFDSVSRTLSGTPPNGSSGAFDVEITATDIDGLMVSDTFTVDVSATNFAPTLDNPIADAGATEGDALTLTVPSNTFSDPDTGDSLTYSAQLEGGGVLPGWLNFDVATRTFTGTPPNNSNGSVSLQVTVTDNGGLSVSDTFVLSIDDSNFAPNLDNVLIDANAMEGAAFSLVVPANSFSDPDDGDTLTYAARQSDGNPLPVWLNFDSTTRTFTGTPPNNSNGNIDIEVVTTDSGGLTAADTFVLTIADANFAPSLDNAIVDTNTAEGATFSYTIPANTFSDPDIGDTLTYSAQLNGGGALPAWLTFDPATRTFTGIPPNNSNGNIEVDVVVTDTGGLSVSDSFTLNIADTNFAPSLDNALVDANAAEGQAFNLAVPVDTFSDSDIGDTLTLSARLVGGAALPSWLNFDAVAGAFSGTPPIGTEGVIDVEIIATDSGGLTIADAFNISIGSGSNVITGTAGDDVLVGTSAMDQIFGLGGDDTLRGGAGDDSLIGGAGNDDLRGGSGNDMLRGGAGSDSIRGHGGNDDISGGAANDFIRGGGGADTIRGDRGDDEIFGNGGADLIFGGAGNDTISGGNGADEIHGNGGSDIIFGGGSADTISGNGGADTILGENGNDSLSGNGGRDVIEGGAGGDTIIGGAGRDTLSGGDGSDAYIYEIGDGSDTINNASIDAATDTLRFGTGVASGELAFTQSGNDLLIDVGASGGSIRVEGWFASAVQEIDFVETIDDGVVLTAADINTIVATAGISQTSISRTVSDTTEPFVAAKGVNDMLVPIDREIEFVEPTVVAKGGRSVPVPIERVVDVADTSVAEKGGSEKRIPMERQTDLRIGRLQRWFGLRGSNRIKQPRDSISAASDSSTVIASMKGPQVSVPMTRSMPDDEVDDNVTAGDRTHVLNSGAVVPVMTDLAALADAGLSTVPPALSTVPVARISVPMTRTLPSNEVNDSVSADERMHVINAGAVAPIMTDLATLADEGLSTVSQSVSTISDTQPLIATLPATDGQHRAFADPEFETFRSAIDALDATTVAGVSRRQELVKIGELTEANFDAAATSTTDAESEVTMAGSATDEIDRSLNQFVASIAGFGDARDHVGDGFSSVEDYDSVPQITVPSVN